MAATARITAIGNSLGIILPKELLAKLKLEKGDEIFLSDTPTGFEATPYQKELAAQMDAFREVMRENRDALRELAK